MKRIKLLLIAACILFLAGCSTHGSHLQSHEMVNTGKNNSKSENKKLTNLKITIDGKILNAQLNSTAAAKEFKQELPKTLTFTSFMSNPEKMADLNHSLSLKGMSTGEEGKAGEIG
ncbi:hypothetical protein FP432_02125 [Lactobacillus sp. PV034]|nr:hypothetical protein FP432_02125 [Lactobacillus sp. PV034]